MSDFYKKLVENVIEEDNFLNFKEFLKNCNGCFIVDCVNILRNSKNKTSKTKTIINEISLVNKTDYGEYYKHINYKPVPHMLDSDWRFTFPTQIYIANKLKLYLKNKTKSLFVGTPSLIYNKNVKEILNSDITFVEKNPTSINYRNKIVSNIINYDTKNKYDAIVCDPPWYKKAYTNFILKFSTLLKNNGFLFLVFPPTGVRETIESERKEIVLFAESIGFKLIEEDIETINYYSSPFEINSILANKIKNFPIDWRFGNLLIFKYVSSNINKKYEFDILEESSNWNEYAIKNIRIKIKSKKTNCNIPIFEKIYKNDILPSVSMRNPKIKEINFWTSGNRVFKCNNTLLVENILKDREIYGYKHCVQKYINNLEIVDFIEALINKEYTEYGKYWD